MTIRGKQGASVSGGISVGRGRAGGPKSTMEAILADTSNRTRRHTDKGRESESSGTSVTGKSGGGPTGGAVITTRS